MPLPLDDPRVHRLRHFVASAAAYARDHVQEPVLPGCVPVSWRGAGLLACPRGHLEKVLVGLQGLKGACRTCYGHGYLVPPRTNEALLRDILDGEVHAVVDADDGFSFQGGPPSGELALDLEAPFYLPNPLD